MSEEDRPFLEYRTRAQLKSMFSAPGLTHYRVLGVSPGALTPQALTLARREVTRVFHPDRSLDRRAHELTALANVAYSVLSDAAERVLYDAQLRSTHVPCPICAGLGFKLKTRKFTQQDRYRCPTCSGSGWLLKEKPK